MSRRRSVLPAAAFVATGFPGIACADWQPLSLGKLAAGDDQFGRSVAVRGERIAVGVPESDASGFGGAGAVAIFERIAGAWTRTDLLTASDAATADVLGEYVSLDGDLLLAGAANDGLLDPGAPWTGAGYLFRRGPGGWTQERKFLPPDPIEFHEFGLAGDVDAETATVAIGARLDSDSAFQAGSVYIYSQGPSGWAFRQEIRASDGQAGDVFGFSVAIDGDTIVVGTPGDDDLADASGAAYVFERGPGGFTQVTKLHASDGAFRDQFGISVDVDGDLLAIGAKGTDHQPGGADRGSVYLFRRLGGTWTEAGELTASPSVNLMAFGSAVSLRGGTLAVGAPNASLAGGDSGAVFVFRDKGGLWTQESVFASIVPASGNRLGASVGADGNTTVAGEPYRDQPLTNAGRAWVRAAPPPCPADLDGDGSVGPGDLSVLLAIWDTPGGDGDLDGNGVVSGGDLTVLLGSWGDCPG